jgi:hypothetical protein
LYIPGFGDVSTPAAYARTRRQMPGEGTLTRAPGALLPEGAPGYVPPPDDIDILEDLGSTGPQDDRDTEADSTSTRPFSGSATLPPLTPDQLAALEKRRRASLRGLREAEARAEDLRASAELEEIGRRLGIQEDIAQQRREGMVDLAVRGVARSPLFANPFRRELAREQQRQMAESQQTLANTLDQLNVALNAARQKREQELAQIAFDETVARSNVQRLLGIN